eukprot:2267845-Prorocentrum_lima.AAC.1
MTSSLVGSEMCIRDSKLHRAGYTGAISRPQKEADTVHGAGKGWGPAPVSYTHLTLPTICSV